MAGSMNLRRRESPGVPSRIAALSADQGGAGLTCDDGDPRGVGKITRSMNYARGSRGTCLTGAEVGPPATSQTELASL
jgi:hypothetical protein